MHRYIMYIYICMHHSRHQFLGIARLFCFQDLDKLHGRSRNVSRSGTAVRLVEWTRVSTCASRFSVNTLRGMQSDAGCHDTKRGKKQFKRCVPLSSDSGISKIDS